MTEQIIQHGKILGLIYQQNKICEGFMQKMILFILCMKHPGGATEESLLAVNQGVRPEESVLDVRRELNFLASLGWVNCHRERGGSWFATATEEGMDADKKMREAFMRKTYSQ